MGLFSKQNTLVDSVVAKYLKKINANIFNIALYLNTSFYHSIIDSKQLV